MSPLKKEKERERHTTKPIQKRCSGCLGTEFRRVNRSHWIERTVFTWMGLFPWECVLCRNRRYFRDDGHRRPRDSSRPAGAAS